MPVTDRLPAGILPGAVDMQAIDALARTYALGIPAIDDQHRLLFGWYIALRTTPQIQPVLKALHAYAVIHFRDEERWALQHGVDVEVHRGQHAELLHAIEAQLASGRLRRTSLMATLYDWLTVHIDVEDRSLVTAASQRQAGPPA